LRAYCIEIAESSNNVKKVRPWNENAVRETNTA
jgi:hypothetical protein